MNGRRGLTLLEILIGLALGLMVILAVYGGIRTAVRSITAVERVALENKMLGFALVAAVERADGWDDLDIHDPADPTYDQLARPLRIRPSKAYSMPTAGEQGGLADDASGRWHLAYDHRGADWSSTPEPFTPLAESWPLSSAGSVYDPHDWLPHVAKSWYRGDHAWYGEHDLIDHSSYGNYGLLQASADRVRVVDGDAASVSLAGWRRWLPDQQIGLSYGLGWYGWIDYLPAHALLDFYVTTANDRALKPGEIRFPRAYGATISDALLAGSAPDGDPDTPPAWVVEAGGRGFHGILLKQRSAYKQSLYRTGAGQAISKGWLTWGIHAGISAREPIINRSMAGMYRGDGYYAFGYESLDSMPMLLTTLADERELIEGAPQDWPILTVDIRRFHTWGSPRTHCYIRFTDPISGESRELFMPLTCTTLRGARLSRGLDALP